MKIAVYNNDKNKIPYLVHSIDKRSNKVSLGLELYPEIEQDRHILLKELKLLKKGTKRFKFAETFIKNLLAL